MLKLMKYEFKKQMFSKIIIAAILGVLTLYFGIACVIDKETHAAIATMLIFTVMVFAGLYTAVESLSVYDKDLKTKQSYMLFLVPRSSYEILGAKMISAALQNLFYHAALRYRGGAVRFGFPDKVQQCQRTDDTGTEHFRN